MLTSVFSFFGGAAFRAIWGEIASFISKKQDHEYEMERMKLQSDLDDKAHQRQLETIKLQTEKEISIVTANVEAATSAADDQAFLERIRALGRPSGNKYIDAWNSSITPFLATTGIAFMFYQTYKSAAIVPWVLDIISSALGMYVADRRLSKRGK